jgi:hypothetical protein
VFAWTASIILMLIGLGAARTTIVRDGWFFQHKTTYCLLFLAPKSQRFCRCDIALLKSPAVGTFLFRVADNKSFSEQRLYASISFNCSKFGSHWKRFWCCNEKRGCGSEPHPLMQMHLKSKCREKFGHHLAQLTLLERGKLHGDAQRRASFKVEVDRSDFLTTSTETTYMASLQAASHGDIP